MENIKEEALKEAIKIGDHLLSVSESNSKGLYWKTGVPELGLKQGFQYKAITNLYNGVSGICIFMAELYRQTGDQRYLDASQKGMDWAISESTSNVEITSFAYFTGQLSIAITLARLYELTSDSRYIDRSVRIALEAESFASSPISDVLNGSSGTLLGLLRIHSLSRDSRLLKVIERYVDGLLSKMKSGKLGVHWDRNELHMRSLCGFSHGASGLAYVFMELAHYFANPSFYEVARQAFLYEKQYFNTEYGNWRDLRGPLKSGFEHEVDEAYERGDRDFFFPNQYMCAWCHGAPGIGLAKLRAIETQLDDTSLRADLSICLQTTWLSFNGETSHLGSGCLCHGTAGNAELFLAAYQNSKDAKYLHNLRQIVQGLFEQKRKCGRYISGLKEGAGDNGLFLGVAGVGYFFLRVVDPENTPSVLAPRVNQPCQVPFTGFHRLSISVVEIHKIFVLIDFARSYHIIEELYSDKLKQYFARGIVDDYSSDWCSFVKSLIKGGDKSSDILKDVFDLESSIRSANLRIESGNLIFIKERKKSERKGTLLSSAIAFRENVLAIDDGLQIVKTNWCWDLTEKSDWAKNLQRNAHEFSYLLIPTFSGIRERRISEFTKTVLETFENPLKVSEGVRRISKLFDSSDSIQQIGMLIVKQIDELIEAGLLLQPDMHPLNKRTRSLLEPISTPDE